MRPKNGGATCVADSWEHVGLCRAQLAAALGSRAVVSLSASPVSSLLFSSLFSLHICLLNGGKLICLPSDQSLCDALPRAVVSCRIREGSLNFRAHSTTSYPRRTQVAPTYLPAVGSNPRVAPCPPTARLVHRWRRRLPPACSRFCEYPRRSIEL